MLEKGQRVAKVIANSGYCSKRCAEKLIEEGRVKVNGKIIDTPIFFITDQSIKIDNKLLKKREKTKMWIFNKPKGYIVTNNDPQGRKNIYNLLPKNMPRVISVGRLDMDTEGLLLLTNNGDLSRYIEHPKTAWTRQYLVKVHGNIKKLVSSVDKIAKNGIIIDGMKYSPAKITIEKQSETTNNWLKISITEGKNREVRKIMNHFGLRVIKLKRTSFGPFHLGNLVVGAVKPVPDKVLKEAIGNKVDLS